MFVFGERSSKNLSEADESLQRVAKRALSFGVTDFSIIEGHRTLQEQRKAYEEGKSSKDGINKRSKHQSLPSKAIDIMPWPADVNGVNVWDDNHRWCVLAGLMYAAAAIEGVKITWGGDWDSDGNNADSKFNDYPHYEVE